MAFPKEVQIEALVACGRCCCLCHKFCGTKMELHHIIQKADGGEDTFENCIPLCFECHADMGKIDAHHPKGKSYTPEELKRHRENWYQRKQTSVSYAISDNEKALFQEICDVFLPLRFTLTEADLSCGVNEDKFDLLIDFLHEDGAPFKEFLDGDMESARASLVNYSIKFINYFSLHMFTWNNRLVPHVYLMSINEISYNSELEEHFQEEAMILNSLATDLWKEFQSFVRAYRFHTEYCGTP